MSEYFGSFVSEMPELFTPVQPYKAMNGLGATGAAKATDVAETTQMIKDVTPLIQSLGPLFQSFGPIITGFIETAGAGAVPLVEALPLPAKFKSDFKKAIGGAQAKARAQQAAAKKQSVKPQAPAENKFPIVPVAAGVGVLIVGVAVASALGKKKKR